MLVVCNYEGRIHLPLADKDPQRILNPGANEVPEEYFSKLTEAQQRTIVKLWDRKLISFETPEAPQLPAPAADPTSASVELDVLLPAIATMFDVALLDQISRQDARPEVQQACLARALELDKMPARELEALQGQASKPPEEPTLRETPASKRKGGRPKGSKNKTKGDTEPPPTLPASE